jgi:hypothetical protein
MIGEGWGAVDTCGCTKAPRWRCDLCDDASSFVACSRACLEKHLTRLHGDAGARPCLERTIAALGASNGSHQENWAAFEPHRVRLMALLGGARGEGGICVLGAGNCDDLDLPSLLRDFGEVHLVDLDGDALRRGVARLDAAERRRVVLHEADLTGLLATVETWGESDAALAVVARRAAEAIAKAIGRTFRVVLSSCVVTQLCVPFYRSLARSPAEWAAIMETVGRIHLRTVALLTRPGGIGVLIGDSLYASRDAASDVSVPTWDSLDPVAEDRLRNGPMLLRNPQFLLTLVHEPSVASLVERPNITQPWLWTVEDGVMLVYAISMRRRASTPDLDPGLVEIHVSSNLDTEHHWELYADHRRRSTSLVIAQKEAATLCVLGAGNANALDLDLLAERFSRIHLVDIDAAALSRAIERQPPPTRDKLVQHAPLDVSGLMRLLPGWRERAPSADELDALRESAPSRIAASLPGPFDVVLSDCLLTQIYWTCFKALGNGPPLQQVLATSLSIHLRTMAELTRSGGAALLVTDAVTSETVPLVELVADKSPREVLCALDGEGALFSGTSPALIVDAFERAGLGPSFDPPEVVEPWIWNVGRNRIALVYALPFVKR